MLSWRKYIISILIFIIQQDSKAAAVKFGKKCLANIKNDKATYGILQFMPNDRGDIHRVKSYDTSLQENGKRSFFDDEVYTVPCNYMKFLLYTRKNKEKGEILAQKCEVVSDWKDFKCGRATKVLVHGWKSHGEQENGMPMRIKDAYLETGDYNIIVVDWGETASNDMYIPSCKAVAPVATYVAQVIDSLISEGADPKTFHLIGHSLGAHVIGIAGMELKTESIQRITALDPAGPCFAQRNDDSITPFSATFVDVIHTNIQSLGYAGRLGDVDFYPNGGDNQPGCEAGQGIFCFELVKYLSCQHSKSWWYFRESILNKHKFPAIKCSSYKNYRRNKCKHGHKIYMGDYFDVYAEGKYYLSVTEDIK